MFRNQKLALELLTRLQTKHPTVQTWQLEVAANNHPAIQLYKKCGFILVGRRKKYYKDGADALLMTKQCTPS